MDQSMGERTASSGRKLAGVWNSGLFFERVRRYVQCHQAAGVSKPTHRFEAFGTKRRRGRYSATAGLVGGWQLEMEDHQPDSRRQSHGFVAMKSLYRLDQFDRVLALRNRDGLPHLLIGSQAVKFWAGLFADQGIGPRRTEAVHQRRHRLQRRPGRCRTHCSATEAPRGSTREGWNDRPGRLHPLHMGRHRVQHRCCPSGSGCASEPGKPSDPVGFLLKRTANKSARRVAREMDFDWSGLLPWAVLKASRDPKLARFVEDRSRQTPWDWSPGISRPRTLCLWCIVG